MIVDILLVCLIAILLALAFWFTILPLFIPGIILTIIAALIFIFWKGLAALGIFNLGIILAMGLIYFLIDWLSGVLGATKFGGSKYGIWGAILGGLAGIPFGGIFGVIIGTMIGAMAFEFFLNRVEIKKSLKIGLGAGVGFMLGAVGKIIVVSIATIAFLWGIIK